MKAYCTRTVNNMDGDLTGLERILKFRSFIGGVTWIMIDMKDSSTLNLKVEYYPDWKNRITPVIPIVLVELRILAAQVTSHELMTCNRSEMWMKHQISQFAIRMFIRTKT